MWACRAVIECNGEYNISLAVRNDKEGAPIPALPDDLFEHSLVQSLRLQFLNACETVGEKYFDSSLVKLFSVNNVPLKPMVKAEDFPEWQRYLNMRDAGLGKLHAEGIIPLNPAADLDLLRILGLFYKETKEDLTPLYHVLLCDVNLFNRSLKVSCSQTFFSLVSSSLSFSTSLLHTLLLFSGTHHSLTHVLIAVFVFAFCHVVCG